MPSSTARVTAANSSDERPTATALNNGRTTKRPNTATPASSSSALPSVQSSAVTVSSPCPAKAGTRASSGTTARSCRSRIAKVRRPRRDASSPRSDSSCRTTAVDDSARPPPMITAVGSVNPTDQAMDAITTEVTTTCAVPTPNIWFRITLSRSTLSSRPIVNSRNTTPSSAIL